MQEAGSLVEGGRVSSPDITRMPYTFQSHCAPSPAGNNNLTCVQNLNAIAEVPQGFYEFVFGENGEARILCRICQYISNKKSNFKRHFTNMHFVHHEDKLLECCGIRFATKGEKVHHTKSVHKFGYKCVICTKVFDRPALLQRHLAKHTGKKPYKCSLCTYQTPNKANAKRHIEKKHSDSDVQEGSILFVTEDGDQVEMEIVPKGIKSEEGVESVPIRDVITTKADSSTSTGFQRDSTSPYSISFKLPRFPPSATVTSSSRSPAGNTNSDADIADPLSHDIKPETKRQSQISHSIDKIMNSYHNAAQTAAPVTTSETKYKGNNISDNGSVSNSYISRSHLDFNQLQQQLYYSPNWTGSSSLLPINKGDYSQSPEARQSSIEPNFVSTAASTALPNQSSLSPLFYPHCYFGCWHQLLHNQAASDYSSYHACRRAYFLPRSPSTYSGTLLSPDLRFSSSISQQTENSSITSLKSEDEDDEIDIMGDESDEKDAVKLKLLSTICEGLGSCTTNEIQSQRNSTINKNDEMDNNAEQGTEKGQSEKHPRMDVPPVDYTSRRSSITNSRGGDDDDNENREFSEEQYIPKKLRLSKSRAAFQ